MSFLSKLANGGAVHPFNEEQLGSIRVVVVGEPSVGKTALTELISNGHPAKTSRSTAGCHIHVKLLDTPGSQPGDNKPPDAQQRRFFVELWDVSGQPKYEQLRSVFYKQINGVILVYDLSNRKTLTRLPKWASEIARGGSFVAPFADELASRNIGGLPVPVLVVGNKADRLRHGAADASSLSSMINSACSQALASSACGSWWQRSIGGLRGRRAPSDSSMAPDMLEQHVKGLTASAASGQLDWELLHSFFAALWERRYKPLTGGSAHEYMHRTASFSGAGPSSSLSTAAAAAGGSLSLKGPSSGLMVGSSSEVNDQRLDDDWV